MKKLAILLSFIVISQNVFLSSVYASLGRVAQCLLGRTLAKQHTLPSRFKEIVSPKRVGSVIHWGSTFCPFLLVINNFKHEKQKMLNSSKPLDLEIKDIIKKGIGVNPDNIRLAHSDCTGGEYIFLSENTIANLKNNDPRIQAKGFGVLLHEFNHSQNDKCIEKFILGNTKGILFATSLGKILKIIKGPVSYSYTRSIINGLSTAPLKIFSGILFYLKDRRISEYAADNVQHNDPEIRYKVLDGLEQELKAPLLFQPLNLPPEILRTHPDKKKRIIKTAEYKKDILLKHPELAKKVLDGTIWESKKTKQNKNFLAHIISFLTFGKY